MRGLVRKDIFVFFKSVDKRTLLIIVGAVIIMICNLGPEAGLVASIMLALTVGIQNIVSFALDEKIRWNQYQMAMPLSSFQVVASKYISFACTLSVSLLGSVVLNLVTSIVYRSFEPSIWLASGVLSVVLPLMWAGVALPMAYWFGFYASRILSIFMAVPMCLIVKDFEDGPGLPVTENLFHVYFPLVGITAAILFGLSMMVSIAGYRRRK